MNYRFISFSGGYMDLKRDGTQVKSASHKNVRTP